MAWSICSRAFALVLAVLRLQAATETAPHENVFDELLAWMQEGIDKSVPEVHRLGLQPLQETLATRGRTFVARRDLQKGELLVRFPKENLMDAGYFLGEGSPFATSLSKANELNATEKVLYLTKWVDIVPHTWIALYILEQRNLGEASFWHQYLKLVPSEFPGNPLFYAEKEFEWLQGSTFVQQAKLRLEKSTKQYQIASQLFEGFASNFSLEEFLWACSAVISRVFGHKLPGLESGTIWSGKSGFEHSDFMVPIGDMFNHRSPKNLEWKYNEAARSFDIWVSEDVAAGGELFNSYGIKSNTDNLLMYGFAVPDLPKRDYPVCSVPILVGLNDVPDQEAKRAWLTQTKRNASRDHKIAFSLRDVWEKEPDTMLAHIRLLELSDMKEVKRQMSPRMKNCQRITRENAKHMTVSLCPNPVSIPNEQAALKRCLRVIREAIQAYPTTLDEDELLLPTIEGLPASLVTLRRDEKVVLRYWERFFDLALDALTLGSGSSIERRCNEVLGQAKCSVENNHYMRKILPSLLGASPPGREQQKYKKGKESQNSSQRKPKEAGMEGKREKGDSASDPGILGSKAPWLILGLVAAAFMWWRNASQRQRPRSGASPGRKDKKEKRK